MTPYDITFVKTTKNILKEDRLFSMSLQGDRNSNNNTSWPLFIGNKEWLETKLKQNQEFRSSIYELVRQVQRLLSHYSNSNCYSYYQERDGHWIPQLLNLLPLIQENIKILTYQVSQLERFPNLNFSTWQHAAMYSDDQRKNLMLLMDDSEYACEELNPNEIEWIRVALREIFHNHLKIGFEFFSKLGVKFLRIEKHRKKILTLLNKSFEATPNKKLFFSMMTDIELWWIAPGRNQLGRLSSTETLSKLNRIVFNPKQRLHEKNISCMKQRHYEIEEMKTLWDEKFAKKVLEDLLKFKSLSWENRMSSTSMEPFLLLTYDDFPTIKKHVESILRKGEKSFYNRPCCTFRTLPELQRLPPWILKHPEIQKLISQQKIGTNKNSSSRLGLIVSELPIDTTLESNKKKLFRHVVLVTI